VLPAYLYHQKLELRHPAQATGPPRLVQHQELVAGWCCTGRQWQLNPASLTWPGWLEEVAALANSTSAPLMLSFFALHLGFWRGPEVDTPSVMWLISWSRLPVTQRWPSGCRQLESHCVYKVVPGSDSRGPRGPPFAAPLSPGQLQLSLPRGSGATFGSTWVSAGSILRPPVADEFSKQYTRWHKPHGYPSAKVAKQIRPVWCFYLTFLQC
jgi:hypothetical protein